MSKFFPKSDITNDQKISPIWDITNALKKPPILAYQTLYVKPSNLVFKKTLRRFEKNLPFETLRKLDLFSQTFIAKNQDVWFVYVL